MFRKRIGDQSESKIDSDKYLLKKIKLDLPGHGEGLFGLYTLLNAVIDRDQFKLTIVCFRTFIFGRFECDHKLPWSGLSACWVTKLTIIKILTQTTF